MIKNIIQSTLNKLIFKYSKPIMVLGFKRHIDKKVLAYTRISNTTSITGSEHLNIEDNVFIGHFNTIDASCGLTIKTGCQISNYVSILTHSSHIAIRLYGDHYIEYNGKHHGYIRDSTIIGAYTFIGPHSTIMPGANIGRGSIVKAYSLVKKGTYPDYAILSGNPATVVGDTRNLDRPYLEKHPELKKYYIDKNEIH